MARKSGDIGQRAWRILRLALLWARKGGVFRRRFLELRLVPRFLKTLTHSTNTNTRPHFFYGERQLSFDNTPTFHLKMHHPASLRFNLPCITPQVDFDCDFDFDQSAEDHRISFLKDKEEEITEEFGNEEEKGIDLRAQEFIAQFYEQIRLQRQISYLQYNDGMFSTSTD